MNSFSWEDAMNGDMDKAISSLKKNPFIDDYDRFREKYGKRSLIIGRGSYGVVYITDKNYVIKESKMLNNSPQQDVIAEIAALKLLEDDSKIIKLYDFFFTEKRSFLVLEKAEKDTDSYVSAIYKTTPQEIENYQNTIFPVMAADIALSVDQMQRKNVLHRDIKPANILKTASGFKMADFGLSRFNVCPYLENTGEVYTITYRPPELLWGKNKVRYDFSADIWAMGMSLFELYTGLFDFMASGKVVGTPVRTPKKAPAGEKTLYWEKISSNMQRFLANKDKNLSRITDLELRDLLSQILMENPLDRLTIDQIIRHPYLIHQYSVIAEPISCFQKYLNGDIYIQETKGVVDESIIEIAEDAIEEYSYPDIKSVEEKIVLESSLKIYAGLKYLVGSSPVVIINTMPTTRTVATNSFESDARLIKTIVILFLKVYEVGVVGDSYASGQISVLYYMMGILSFTVPHNFVSFITDPLIMDGLNTISDQQKYITSKTWLNLIVELLKSSQKTLVY